MAPLRRAPRVLRLALTGMAACGLVLAAGPTAGAPALAQARPVGIMGSSSASASAAVPAPLLTVVGFGLATVGDGGAATASGPAAQPPQVNLSFTAEGPGAAATLYRLSADLSAARARLAAAGVPPADVTSQAAPALSYVPAALQYQARASLQVNASSLQAAASLLDRLRLASLRDLDSMWVNVFTDNGTPAAAPAAASMTAAYGQAFADAARTAQIMAKAEGLALGPEVSATEGAPPPTSCGQLGQCAGALAPGIAQPPFVGPNQQLVAVTVTYGTVRPSGT